MNNTKEKLLQQLKQTKQKLLAVVIAIAATSLLVGLMFPDNPDIGGCAAVILIGDIVIGFSTYFIYGGQRKKQIMRSFCPHCEAKFDYEEDVSWKEVGQTIGDTLIKSDVLFECECHECGKKTKFQKKLTIAAYNKNNDNWTTHDIDTLGAALFLK